MAEVAYFNLFGSQAPPPNETLWVYLHQFENPTIGKWVERRQLGRGEHSVAFATHDLRPGGWYCFRLCTSPSWWRWVLATSAVFQTTDFGFEITSMAQRTAAASAQAVVMPAVCRPALLILATTRILIPRPHYPRHLRSLMVHTPGVLCCTRRTRSTSRPLSTPRPRSMVLGTT